MQCIHTCTWIQDVVEAATITRAAKVQCWPSYNVQHFRLAFEDKVNAYETVCIYSMLVDKSDV